MLWQWVFLKEHIYVTMVNGNKPHQPIEGWIQNHTKNLSKKTKSQGDPACVNFIMATHIATQ